MPYESQPNHHSVFSGREVYCFLHPSWFGAHCQSTTQLRSFMCPKGNTSFSVHRVKELPKTSGIHIYFEYENLDEEVQLLQNKGIAFDELPKDQPWLWREARLKDPDGNQLILYHAGENRLNPPWRIASS